MDKVSSTQDFIEVTITPSILQEAQNRELSFRNKYGNNGTHRTNKEKQRITGYLAEAAIAHTFPNHMAYSTDDSYDFLYLNKYRVDSKAQGCNSIPKPDYAATLYEEQRKRPTDIYIFSRVQNDHKKIWIAGVISKKNFFKIAQLIPAGTQNNNFTYDQPRYQITYTNLYKPENISEKNI
jgi:hypothetical protein